MDGIGALLFLAVPLMLLFVLSSRTRRQQREALAVQAALAPGQRVMTAGGMFGIVTEAEGDTVVLAGESGQLTRWDRRAVARVVPDDSADVDSSGDASVDAEPDLRGNGRTASSTPGQDVASSAVGRPPTVPDPPTRG